MIVLSVAGVMTTSATADAVAYREIWTQQFTGPNALQDCSATGQAGRGSRWDFYRCTDSHTSVWLHGYIFIS
jgi:hypothetical protein